MVLERNSDKARAIARVHTQYYLRLTNYVNNLRRLGYTEEDVTGVGSDRLVDDIVAWGDLDAVASRIEDHFQAGANHVSVQVFTEDTTALPMKEWEALAGRLLN